MEPDNGIKIPLNFNTKILYLKTANDIKLCLVSTTKMFLHLQTQNNKQCTYISTKKVILEKCIFNCMFSSKTLFKKKCFTKLLVFVLMHSSIQFDKYVVSWFPTNCIILYILLFYMFRFLKINTIRK